MATEVQLTGVMRKGVLTIRNLELLKQLRNGEVYVTVTRAYATRSPKQNAYYHGYILRELSEATGHEPEELHEWCKWKFNPQQLDFIDTDTGEIAEQFVVGGSTAKLGTMPFEEYLEKIKRWAAGPPLCLYLKDPDPNWKANQDDRDDSEIPPPLADGLEEDEL
jgi:hypothetical protein